jgi:hypothetical protein
MNQKEQDIITKILGEISSTGKDHRFELIDQYRAFLQAVETRAKIELAEAQTRSLAQFLTE